VNAYIERANSYQNLNQLEKALKDLIDATNIDRNSAQAFAWKGYVNGRMNNFEAAVEDYSISIKLNAADHISFHNRGLYYNRLGMYEKAVADYKSCLDLNPQYGQAYIGVISPLLRLEQFDEAIGYYKEYRDKKLTSYIESSGNKYYQHYIKGLTLLQQAKYEDALESLVNASDAFGENLTEETKRAFIDILFLQGVVMERLNLTTDAQILYEQSLVIDSRQPDLEMALQRLHDLDTKTVESDVSVPELSIITPSTVNLDLGSGTVEVVGRAKDIAGIEYVKINGEPVEKLEEDGLFISKLKLSPGENKWVLTASDKKGNIATKNLVFFVTGNASRGTSIISSGNANTAIVIEKEPVYHAILIAEQNYDDPKFQDLQNPRRDALALGAILEKDYGFSPENIDTLFDKSRDEIMTGIVKKASSLNENENLIIFYAGHGTAVKGKGDDVDGYWVPISARRGDEFTYISADDIKKVIKRSNSKHILIIADACFSGAMTRGLPPDAAKEVNRQYNVASRKVMASGNLEEVPDKSKFIFYLQKRLEENTEKYLTAKDLFDSFYKAVLVNTETQPQYAAIKNVGDEGGEFVFIRKN
jgi:tetratricopeptide (TPR) repeat protein